MDGEKKRLSASEADPEQRRNWWEAICHVDPARLVFETFVEQVLAPTLQPGQIVIWDNLSVHRSPRARQVIEACGGELRFLPPYSPDFNPIEQAFSKLKNSLRWAEQRTRDGLWDAIGQGPSQITTQDARGWFHYCEYSASDQYS